MSAPLEYEALVAAFEHSLLTQLRGHGSDHSFLEGWVPDEDAALGLLNMLEAAEIAGEPELGIRIAKATLPADRLSEIRTHGEEFGTVDIADEGDAWLLQFGEIGSGRALRNVAAPYRAALRPKLEARRLEHAGRLELTSAGAQLLTVAQDGITLSVTLDASGKILDARHDGASDPVVRAALDHLCALLSGMPVQEASDHGGHHLLAQLSAPEARRPVSGIVLPENADPIFAVPRALSRALLAKWRSETGYNGRENEFSPPPDSPWSHLADEARCEAVAVSLAGLLHEAGEPADALILSGMESNILGYPVRAIVSFGPELPPERKPDLARRAEAHLKRALEPQIELYVEELKDQNVIRRL